MFVVVPLLLLLLLQSPMLLPRMLNSLSIWPPSMCCIKALGCCCHCCSHPWPGHLRCCRCVPLMSAPCGAAAVVVATHDSGAAANSFLHGGTVCGGTVWCCCCWLWTLWLSRDDCLVPRPNHTQGPLMLRRAWWWCQLPFNYLLIQLLMMSELCLLLQVCSWLP